MTALPFNNSYARLPDHFHRRVQPTRVKSPRLIRLNLPLSEELGLDFTSLDDAAIAQLFSGNQLPENAEPIATAYAGHQFGSFVPQLGDGRAILLGEVIDRSGTRRDIQLKGAGRTPFSRGGDGRAAIGPVLREYVLSEAMASLGIPTTRSLAAVTTGEVVMRETPLPGAVLTRVASSHIRVGTFQFFASRRNNDAVRTLADHVIARHYPHVADVDHPHRAMLDAVISAQARLIAQWLHVGFIHGVMNTDNMSVAGETIDYGPCAFLDEYDPNAVFSSIDRGGRYAYGQQPVIGEWNLMQLASCLVPLLGDDTDEAIAQANEALAQYRPTFQSAYREGLRHKIGLLSQRDGTDGEQDDRLAQDLLDTMANNLADFTNTFRALCDASEPGDSRAIGDVRVRALFSEPSAYDQWAVRWRERLAEEPMEQGVRRVAMQRVNPAFIPRNHRVEAVIRAAVEQDNFAPFEELVKVLERPYDDQPEYAKYMDPPMPEERVRQTFCGT